LAPAITALDTVDVRFPTSLALDGSDAMNPAPDYSAAYVIVRTDANDGLEGHGFAFTIGRGNEVQVAAIDALAPLVVGLDLAAVLADLGGFWRRLAGDSQLRWLGPEKGVIHMAVAAVVNAVWDLYAKRERKPLWKLLADMEPEEIVALVDFRHLTDALTPASASGAWAPTVSPRTRPAPDGSAIPTTSCAGSCARRSATASRTSS
jgi:L-fuconate dehydratase